MSHYIYILYSNKIDKYYVGYSQDPEKRLTFHNSEYNKIWSKRGQPWESKVVIEFSDKKAALQAEKFVKRQKSIDYIKKVIQAGKIVY